MRNQNTRATLIEAVIAGGLIAVGVATGQPLVAVASSMAGVGGNWAYSLAERGFKCWREQWFTDDGVLNHDILKALCNAFVDAVRQVEYDWKQQRQYLYLRRQRPEQAQLTLDTLRLLREDGVALLQQPHQLSQVAQQQPDYVLSFMHQDKSKANEYLEPALASFLHGHDDEFVKFVTVQLGPKWILRFLEILKDPDKEGTRAWRACQLLWQKSLMSSIEKIQRTTAETADTVHRLQEWGQQLKSLPPTERDPTGQDALEPILHSVRAQLSEMQNTLDKTYAATMDIKATALDIKTTQAEIVLALQKSPVRPSTASEDRNRANLIARVRSHWIENVLERSMDGATFIPLGLYERPDLVNPWTSHVQEVKRAGRQLPTDTSLTQVYDKAAGELLILGEPGSGKTTLLLNLARELLDRADLDSTSPIPVVFNLSTWADKRQPLTEWLIEELHSKYRISPKFGKPWLETGEVLPLLDGLDEVAAEYRAACVGAMNAFQRTQEQSPLVIGSRLAEYTTLDTKIVLQQAIMVQPMTLPQIQEYLGEAEGQFQELLRDEPAFRDLAQNPLMLSILKQTYQGKKVHIIENVSPEVRRQQIFTDYVESVFQRRGVATRYSPEQTKDWLIWLAQQMKQREKTEFYLEHLQIDWLANSRRGEIYTSLAFGILSFPVAASLFGLEYTVYGLQFALVNGILAGLLTAIIAFFFVLLIETGFRLGNLFPSVKGKKPVRKAEEKSEKQTKLGAFLTPLFWERSGFALFSGLLVGLLVEFTVGPLYGSLNGLFIAAFLIVLGKFERTIHPAEKLNWRWESFRKNAVVSLLMGIGIGVFGGLFDAYPYFQQLNVFLATLYFWLSLGVVLGIIIMLLRGYSKDEIDKSKAIKPNQGIRNSLSNSLRVGLSSGTLLGLVVFFFYSYVIHNVFVVGYINEIPKNSDVIYSVGDAVAVAYLFWLINGGVACVQHFMLRFYLWRTKCAPWDYPRFLDEAVERTLLRKVGGGYIFMHELLRDHFASLGTEKLLAERKQQISPPADVRSKSGESNGSGEDRGVPTEPHLLVPVLTADPRLLSCGHEQSNPQAQFCAICGRPISPETLEQ